MFSADEPGQRTYGWADAWRAVDGGLITLVADNSKTGWAALPDGKKDWPEVTAPLVEKAKYCAIGCDWTERSRRAGIRMRATCEHQDEVKPLHHAAMVFLNRWSELFEGQDKEYEKDHTRILQFFSSVKVQPSPAGGEQHFVHAKAEVAVKDQELIGLLRHMLQ